MTHRASIYYERRVCRLAEVLTWDEQLLRRVLPELLETHKEMERLDNARHKLAMNQMELQDQLGPLQVRHTKLIAIADAAVEVCQHEPGVFPELEAALDSLGSWRR